MGDVHVAGVGMTEFGSFPARTGRELFGTAGKEAFAETPVSRDAVDAVYVGNFMGELVEQQGQLGPLLAAAAGVDAPATRVESACASGGVAIRQGVKDIRSGDADVVLVGGVERMSAMDTTTATGALAVAADALWERRQGLTFAGAYALMAQRYFTRYGGSREDLAHIAVKNHDHALENPLAQFQRTISVEAVLDAPPVALPIGLYDASPITDGAAAAILVSAEYAAENGLETPVRITGTGQGADSLALTDRDSLVQTPATTAAAETAYADAAVTTGEIDVLEVHDCFTIAEVLALESLGFYEPGEAITAARTGATTATGDLPVNLSGGLKAKGHPVGATGVAQLTEMTKLLRGEHVNSDAVEEATVGLLHNAGGTVASAVVHIVEAHP